VAAVTLVVEGEGSLMLECVRCIGLAAGVA
jgi:hypothetical protein